MIEALRKVIKRMHYEPVPFQRTPRNVKGIVHGA